ncbi:MAG: UDP-glucose 4-epimerase GalE [Prolixibacteraceae bacterium]|nr:UDP-glucose 4-epimerase GalE [Prolixibacteraceae bacterium]
MKVLVTGGAGYIGSHTVKKLCELGFDVTVLDNLCLGHVDAIDKNATFVQADLLDKNGIHRKLANQKFDAVIHFAANSLVGESVEKPMKYIGDNVQMAVNLLGWMQENNINKFILSSTANLFGKPNKIPIDEDTEIIPGSPYGESKYIIERMLACLGGSNKITYTSLRYFNAAGAYKDASIGEDHKIETHLIPLVIQVALGKRDKITIFGDDYETKDGTCIRDYVHVSDLATAHILALKHLGDNNSSTVYNLGSGNGYSVKEVVDAVQKITGKAVKYEVGNRRAGDPPMLIASSNKIKKELGWVPKYDNLEKIISSAWEWHKNNPNGFRH